MNGTAPIGLGRTIRTLFVSSRPISWINTAFPFAAAYLLAVRQIDATLIVGTIFFLVPYNLAMYGINDVFDYESDLRNPRKGGAHGAVLDRRLHAVTLWAAGLSCLPFVVYLTWVGSPLSWLVLAISLFFVVFYSAPPLRLKEVPFADSVTSSIHFFSPAVYGLVLAGVAWTPGLVAIVVAFALWGVAHIIAFPEPSNIILCGAMMLLALGGAAMQDRKKERLKPAAWAQWEAETSYWPFAAIASARARLGGFGMHTLAGGLVLWLAASWALRLFSKKRKASASQVVSPVCSCRRWAQAMAFSARRATFFCVSWRAACEVRLIFRLSLRARLA